MWCFVSFFNLMGNSFWYVHTLCTIQLCGCGNFCCCGGKANLVRIFLLNPRFFFSYFLLYMDLQPYSHNCFSEKSRALFLFRNNTYWFSLFKSNNSLIFRTGVSCFSVTLFYSTLLALTDRRNHSRRNEYTCFALAGGTFFHFQLCCCVSFLFWREIGCGFTYYLCT